MNAYLNTFFLLLLAVVVGGAGYYVTYIRQPEQITHYEDMRQVARLEHARVEQLLAEAEKTSDRADAVVRRWNTRYRYVPDSLLTPEIVEYLEDLTPRGFEAFDITLESTNRSADVSHYTFSIDGTAYYSNLYDFIWKIENRPDFYRIRDLSMARTTLYDQSKSDRGREMVRFSMKLDALFAGGEGLSTERDSLATVPADYKPVVDLPHNSFYPLVREAKSDSEDSNLVDVQHSSLVSIAGGRAIFQDGNTQFVVYEGSSVRNGQIVKIDPVNVFVRARLNVDGKTEVVDIQMSNERPSYRQAEGDSRLVPVETSGNEPEQEQP